MSLWNQEGIPHKGWTCRDMEDLGADIEHLDADSRRDYYEQCEMCKNEGIRYVHIMEHSNYPDTLRVGQQCAEKMENEYSPKKRETVLRNKTNRRLNFLKKEWIINAKGNHLLRYKGQNITIMKKPSGIYGVVYDGIFIWEDNGKKMRSIDKAKLVAFELFDERTHT